MQISISDTCIFGMITFSIYTIADRQNTLKIKRTLVYQQACICKEHIQIQNYWQTCVWKYAFFALERKDVSVYDSHIVFSG
jgi:hypothetical protein